MEVSRFLIPDRPPVEDKNYIVIFHDLFPDNIVTALDEAWKNIALILIEQVCINCYQKIESDSMYFFFPE